MCGLFGFSRYGDNNIKNLCDITNALAIESSIRGTDATGIAYNFRGHVNIIKDSKAARKIDFKHNDNITALIGHTRHSTQGSEKKNCNNHPFYGKCKNTKFALAHNGVLINDMDLRYRYGLRKTKIETDSYIAVQLLEHKKILDFDSIKFMAEAVEGSFSFSILDSENNIWLVKGDSPLHILKFPKRQMYIYASTEEILWKALIDTELFSDVKSGDYESIDINDGNILKINPTGNLVRGKFNFNDYSHLKYCNWWDYGIHDTSEKSAYTDIYIEDLKAVAAYQGYSPEDIDNMLSSGISPYEIEEYLYNAE